MVTKGTQVMRTKQCLISVTFMASFTLLWLASHRLAAPQPAVSFETARELRDFGSASGLRTFNDGSRHGTSFFIADHSIPSSDFEALSWRHDFGLTPCWRGVIWAAQIKTHNSFIDPEQGFAGHWRVWGNVLVGGDEQLLDHIEELHRNR
jgi:hypothetical protein